MAVKLKDIVLPNTLVYPKIDTFKLFEIMADAPVKNGLVGSYFLGSKNADPTYNFANPALPLIAYGAPDITQTTFSRLSRSRGYFSTQLASTATLSILAIARQPASGFQSPIVASYAKDGSNLVTGDTLLNRFQSANSMGDVVMYAQNTSGGVTNSGRNTPVNPGDFHVFGGVISAVPSVGAFTMSETTDPAYSSAPVPARGISTRALLIGSTYSDSEFLQDADVAAVLIYNTDIGVSSMATMMKWLRNAVGVQAGIWSAPKS
ncbi:hypothetical protein ACRS85_23540 [Pluralibacter gergoviae]|uniref:hypothetical protein n=1 Tax=Pluralibacter gergoviae TaxID=61647 RepID=UPI003EE2DF3A